MRGELHVTLSLLTGFALTLVRVSGVFLFLPLPGSQVGPSMARAAFALAFSIALAPFWPQIDGVPTVGMISYWVVGEAALGLLAGVATMWIAEVFTIGAQVLSVQSGYSFASTIDPSTQADSGILPAFAQLLAGLLFFATGLDHHLMRALGASMQSCPPGSFLTNTKMASALIHIGSEVLSLALRLALPVIGLLLLVDLVLGVLGRVNSQIQLINLAFPVKMLLSLLLLASLASVFPMLYSLESGRVIQMIRLQTAGR